MSIVKVGSQLNDVVKLAIRADRPFLLIGNTGVGKSESLAGVAAELKIGCIVRDLSIMEPVDLAGLPQVRNGRMEFIAPSFLPTSGRGLIIFEELNRAKSHIQAPCLELLTRRMLNDYKLPKGWLPAAAVNPGDGEYLVEEMDPALRARFMQIHVTADVKSWLQWASQNGVHPSVTEFVRITPKIFDLARSNPRSWKYVSDVLKAFEEQPGTPGTLLCGVEGHVGEKLATAFCAFYRTEGIAVRIPDTQQLLGSYPRHRKTVLGLVKAGNTPAMDSMCHSLLVFLQDPEHEQATRDDEARRSNLEAFVNDLPAEHRRQIAHHQGWIKLKKGAA